MPECRPRIFKIFIHSGRNFRISSIQNFLPVFGEGLQNKGNTMKKILIIGATSSIAQETAKIFATSGAALFLVARNQEKMDILAKDLVIRGATQVETALFDATKMGNEEMFLKKIIQ